MLHLNMWWNNQTQLKFAQEFTLVNTVTHGTHHMSGKRRAKNPRYILQIMSSNERGRERDGGGGTAYK